ncbi:MAG TPA: HEAT repeat domain-containing protein [Myxococcales bacterium]
MIFFECRLDQLTADLSRASEEVERLKADLAQSTQREVALKQELAAAESRAGQARRERDEANSSVEASHRERERILDKLIEAEHIRIAGEQVEGLDLAAFIADLRNEVLALRGASPLPVTAASGFTSGEQAGDAFALAGRLGITDQDRAALQAAARFETRSEETLFSLSLRELSAAEPLARIRAAQRLQAMGARAALPAVAAALNAEQDAEVLCALLAACAAANEPTVLPIVQSRLVHDSVEVRLAALEAAVHLNDPTCLAKALDDQSGRMRRRAAILASGDPDAGFVLERAAHDADPSVRRVAVLGLASHGGTRARPALLSALDDDDATVRRAAAKGLSGSFGPEVFAIADSSDVGRRRREIRRLALQPVHQVHSQVQPVSERRPVEPAGPSQPSSQPKREAPPATGEPQEPQEPPDRELRAEVLAKVYAALRGQSDEELVRGTGERPERVTQAAHALVGAGKLVRRGQRYFVP